MNRMKNAASSLLRNGAPLAGALAAAMIFCAAFSQSASAADSGSREALSLAQAKHVVAIAEQKAAELGAPCAVAVVDRSGYLITLDRMDESPMLASVELAPGKARTAALFGKETHVLEDAIHNGRGAATTSGFVMMTGGVPLMIDGKEVGAIGVSSARPDWDEAIATAAAASLAAAR